jgi:hypothetical protein
MTKRITPSDLRREAERLLAAGEMPSLGKVLEAIAEARKTYGPALEALRTKQ